MSAVYDNWERLVSAVLKREELRRIALCESFDTSVSTDFSSRFSIDSSYLEDSSVRPSTQEIDFEELKKATKNFHPDLILGKGLFGIVYKGWIDEHTLTASKPGYGMAVAIKKLKDGEHQGLEEWSKEIGYLSQLRLVKLVGYCSGEDNLALIYEFIPKGSLDNDLFRGGHVSLSWVTRIKVAVDVARGLSFLHDNEKPLIHRNFSTAHILLDGDFNAKISGFTFVRDGPTGDMTHVTTRVVGRLTTRCDVYGFGVFLLELLFARRAMDRNTPRNEQNLVDWATPYLGNKRKLLRVMDPRLEGQFSHKAAYTVATIAQQCVSRMPKQRPKMAEVAAALEKL